MKTALVTGASRGIGKAIADKFREEEYTVIAPNHAELDLDSPVSVDAFVASHASYRFDVIINNAGINEINTLANISDDELDRMMRVNLISPIRLLRGLVGPMKENQYGRIVNIGSIWAIVSREGRLAYSATKNALHGVTNTLALELGPYSILVNTVCPAMCLPNLRERIIRTKRLKKSAKVFRLSGWRSQRKLRNSYISWPLKRIRLSRDKRSQLMEDLQYNDNQVTHEGLLRYYRTRFFVF